MKINVIMSCMKLCNASPKKVMRSVHPGSGEIVHGNRKRRGSRGSSWVLWALFFEAAEEQIEGTCSAGWSSTS